MNIRYSRVNPQKRSALPLSHPPISVSLPIYMYIYMYSIVVIANTNTNKRVAVAYICQFVGLCIRPREIPMYIYTMYIYISYIIHIRIYTCVYICMYTTWPQCIHICIYVYVYIYTQGLGILCTISVIPSTECAPWTPEYSGSHMRVYIISKMIFFFFYLGFSQVLLW